MTTAGASGTVVASARKLTATYLPRLRELQSRASAFITHRDFGYLFGILTLAILILAVIDRSPRRQIAIAIALIVLFIAGILAGVDRAATAAA